jgi:nucleoid-associated protein YgaU
LITTGEPLVRVERPSMGPTPSTPGTRGFVEEGERAAMGKVEKLIVLSVLLMIAVILVVSLTMDDPLRKENLADASTGASKAPGVVEAAAPAAAPTQAPAAAPEGAAPSALLSTNVAVPPAQAEVVAAPQIPAGSILKTTAGLEDSYLADMKFYTWLEGDTFRGVAHKFYGDFTKLTILRRANEGRGEIQVGDKVLIPVFDLDAAPGTAGAPALAAAPTAGAGAKPKAASETKTAAKSTGGARSHIVKEGESLWKIAKQELGAGSRWNEIYEANRDVLSSPEALHTGQRLRIP